jgi:hypothetical protein
MDIFKYLNKSVRTMTRAFSGKVDTGFPSENATNKEELERFPIQPDREAL